jgi:hypothetical protein
MDQTRSVARGRQFKCHALHFDVFDRQIGDLPEKTVSACGDVGRVARDWIDCIFLAKIIVNINFKPSIRSQNHSGKT